MTHNLKHGENNEICFVQLQMQNSVQVSCLFFMSYLHVCTTSLFSYKNFLLGPNYGFITKFYV